MLALGSKDLADLIVRGHARLYKRYLLQKKKGCGFCIIEYLLDSPYALSIGRCYVALRASAYSSENK